MKRYSITDRIDTYPTHSINGYAVRIGKPIPFGATLVVGGINFAVYSAAATVMRLVIFEKGAREPLVELEFPPEFHVGRVYSMIVLGLDHENIEYGFRAFGPPEPTRRDRFNPECVLSDPYAKVISGRDTWRASPDWSDIYPYRSRVLLDDFDWADDTAPRIPAEDLIIYELHVRGFTQHQSAGVIAPGTYAGLREKIPYLKELGVNCVELLPIFEFDEFDNIKVNQFTGERLYNFWGYNTIAFFAPKAGFAATGHFGMQADELKTLVKELHRAGIEIILDVVFNHTAEGNHEGRTISFRGLDNATYYMLTPTGDYYNFSGTGNTFNCNHPVVRDFVLNCLRYWVSEYHIDGFRFDLATILDRDQDGSPLPNPPVLEQLAFDPILRDCKLIAEAWDAGGLYEVGSFPNYYRWSEWNGKYRDTLRQFIKGDPGSTNELATRIVGSPDLYMGRGTAASVNYVTAHDGFTLYDLVSYNEKHNLANGEGNNDGANDNYSWNCGEEGETEIPAIRQLRIAQIKNAMTLLLVSRGIPMLMAGDEFGRTQYGNNNAYCQDNEISWVDWALTAKNAELLRFAKMLIAFRHTHPSLRSANHARGIDYVGSGFPDISWHGVKAWDPDWGPESRLLAVMICGRHAKGGSVRDDHIFVITNAHWEAREVEIPQLPKGAEWRLFSDTAERPPHDVCEPGSESPLADTMRYMVRPRSTVVLVEHSTPKSP